jgi:ubiquinone/menaquinone biosynthesis C-methylase UbiE
VSDPSIPPRYTHGHEAATLASHGARTAATSAAYLLPHLRPGVELLDVGCGPGTITLDLAAAVAPGQVTGIENVEPPLEAARAEAARRGDRTTRFELGDVMALPYADGSFDVVHAHQVLQHLADPVGALREMARVCRPGGRVVARDADYAAMAWHPPSLELERWRATYRAIAHGNLAEPDAGRRLREWANAAALQDVTISASTWTYADQESCTWWGNSQADRISGEAFSHQASEFGLVASDIAAMADGWREWGSHPDAWFVIVHGELLARKR